MSIHLPAAGSRLTLGLALLVAAPALMVAATACGDDEADESAEQQVVQEQADEQAEAEAQAASASDAAEQTDAAPAQQQSQQQAQVQSAEQAAAEPQAQQESQAASEQEAAQEDSAAVDFDPSQDNLPDGVGIASSVVSFEEPQEFRFEAASGEWIRIKVDGKDGMDPIMTVLQPDGTEIASNDDLSAANRDSLLVIQIPVEGLQGIRVGSFDSNSIGQFIIQLDRLDVGVDDDNAVMSIGAHVDGVLNTAGDVDVFEFEASVGEQIFVSVDGDTGVDIFAQIFNPEGVLQQTDDDGGHGLDSEILFQADQAGTWRVEVLAAINSAGQRQLIGAYRITVGAGLPTTELTNDAQAAEVAAAGISFLQAMRDGDAATILALAGPEALTVWGWDNTGDIERDLAKMQSIGLGGDILQQVPLADAINSNRARLYLQFSASEWFRMELILIGGRWLVDDWAHSIGPPSAPALAVPDDDTAADDS